MEAQENKQLAVRKAISAHNEAAASITDLTKDGDDPKYSAMLERINQNLADLNFLAAVSDPADKV
jgi:hypothetical protein